MSFYDIFDRCKISATCRTWHNHEKRVVENPYFERPNWNKTKVYREFFKGTLTYCDRAGCDYEKFDGSRVPVRVVMVIVKTGEATDVDVAEYLRVKEKKIEPAA